MGSPGSGKGTQAKLLADKLGLIHFDTGKYIEQVVHDPANKNNKIIQREKKLFDAGFLNTPFWVLKIVSEKIRKLTESNIIFSGSPRTFYEAFGDKKQTGVIDILKELYGQKKVFIFKLNISEKESIKRNSHRLICSICGAPIINFKSSISNFKNCPFCGGNLRTRTLDKPEIIKTRLKEYKKRTQPIIKEFKRRKYKVMNIGAASLPYKIHQNIARKLNIDD